MIRRLLRMFRPRQTQRATIYVEIEAPPCREPVRVVVRQPGRTWTATVQPGMTTTLAIEPEQKGEG